MFPQLACSNRSTDKFKLKDVRVKAVQVSEMLELDYTQIVCLVLYVTMLSAPPLFTLIC